MEKKIVQKRSDILRIMAEHGAENVSIFGSMAKGTAGKGSDLDVLMRLAPGRSLLDIVAIKQDLEDLLGFEVHVVTEGSISPYLRDRILAEAVSL